MLRALLTQVVSALVNEQSHRLVLVVTGPAARTRLLTYSYPGLGHGARRCALPRWGGRGVSDTKEDEGVGEESSNHRKSSRYIAWREF